MGLGQMERVDYMLELAQWMGSNGVPGADITLLINSALDALYEVEDQNMVEEEVVVPEEDDDDEGGYGSGAAGGGDYAATEAGDISTTLLRAGGGRNSKSRSSTAVGGAAAARSSSSSAAGSTTLGGSKAPLTGGGSAMRGKTASATSVAGSATSASGGPTRPAIGPDGKPIEEEKLPPRLDFKMLEQSARALVMLSSLDSTQSKRTERFLEAVYFVRKSLQLWLDSLYLMYRKQGYAALTPAQRGEAALPDPNAPPAGTEKGKKAPAAAAAAAPAAVDPNTPAAVVYPTLESFQPAVPDFLRPPQEPVLFIAWVASPTQQIVDLMALATAQCPEEVPSKKSLPAIQLSMHYLLQLADELKNAGFCKYALFVYAYCRMTLIYLQPVVPGTAAVLTVIHFSCVKLMLELGLTVEAQALPQYIPSAEFAAAVAVGAKVTAPPPLTPGTYLVKVSLTLYLKYSQQN